MLVEGNRKKEKRVSEHSAEVYGNYAPKIMLETISAGTATVSILHTMKILLLSCSHLP
jgi:hypothetical protein